MDTEALNMLTNASKIASGCGVTNDISINHTMTPNIKLSAELTHDELLDYIMIFLCERINVEYSYSKGGYVLTKLLPEEACSTQGIDFSISEMSQYEDIKIVLKDLGETLLNAGIITDYEIKQIIAPTSSGGIRMTPADGSSNIKIDIGWHDLSWGVQEWKFQGYDCNRFEVERMLSDKISAIYSRKRFRRTKDIYDFFVLTNNFDVSISKLREYIDKRGTIEWDRNPFREDVLTEYAKAYDKLKVLTCDGKLITKPVFAEIIIRLRDFMGKYNEDVKWNHLTKTFE